MDVFNVYYELEKMRVLNWNVRGLGCVKKINVVRDVIRTSRCDIVCFQETKWNKYDLSYYFRLLPSFFETNCVTLHAEGTAGGCLVAWKREYELISSWATRHTVTVVLKQRSTGNMAAVTLVYGLSRDDLKVSFMREIKFLADAIHVPWILVHDFNLVRWLIDRSADF